MADYQNDIEKYLKGELTLSEMHALEKKALHDPFLAEALEGGSSINPNDFEKDVMFLQGWIAKNNRKNRPWLTPLRIAASMSLLLVASYFIYTFVKPDEPVTLAQQVPKELPPPVAGNQLKEAAPLASERKKETVTAIQSEQAKSAPSQPAKREIAEPVPATVTKPELLENEIALSKTVEKESETDIKLDQSTTEESEAIAKDKGGDALGSKKLRKMNATAGGSISGDGKIVRGQITSSDDGSPIPGANVQALGTQRGAVSDAHGNYQVSTDPLQDSLLAISFLGYEKQQVRIPVTRAPVDVLLLSDKKQLSEVAVTSLGIQREAKNLNNEIHLARPTGGEKAFNQYLEKNLHYPAEALLQKTEGEVTVEFTVLPSGDLLNFSIIDGLTGACNEEVIRLVKDGPAWNPSTNAGRKISSTVRVRVKFKLPE